MVTSELSSTLLAMARRWNLELGKPFEGERPGVVAPATDHAGRQLVIKVPGDARSARDERDALVHWNGEGAVRLIDFDEETGTILEERILPGDTAGDAAIGERESAAAFCDVALKLRAGRALPSLPHVQSWLTLLDSTQVGRHGPTARHEAALLLDESREDVLLHGDLHHENILRSVDGWVAVDPKGIIGPPEVEPAAFLRNPRASLLARPNPVAVVVERVRVIAGRMEYHPRRVARWGFVMAVLAAAWADEDGEGNMETERWLQCADVLSAAMEAFE